MMATSMKSAIVGSEYDSEYTTVNTTVNTTESNGGICALAGYEGFRSAWEKRFGNRGIQSSE